jgi:hypothetical protein
VLWRPGAITRRLADAALAAVPPVAVLLAFMILWGGFTPPFFHPDAPPRPENLGVILYGGISLTPIGFTLVMIAVLGVFFVPLFDLNTMTPRWWTIGLALGAILSLLGPSDIAYPHRRSGVWRLIAESPMVGDRAIIFVALGAVGGAIVVLAGRSLPALPRWILGFALGGFILAHLTNPMVWQRYYEPFVLILLALAAYHAGRPLTWIRLAGPALLSMALLLVFVLILLGRIG